MFTVEDAVSQIKNAEGEKRSKIEMAMDEFYCKNLPENIIGADAIQDIELDEANIKRLRQQTQMKASKTKTANYLHGQVVNPNRHSVASNQIQVGDTGKKRKVKSDMALALHDAKEISKLQNKMQAVDQLENDRRGTMIDRRGSKLGASSPKRVTVMGGLKRRSSGFAGMMPAEESSGQNIISKVEIQEDEWDQEREERSESENSSGQRED